MFPRSPSTLWAAAPARVAGRGEREGGDRLSVIKGARLDLVAKALAVEQLAFERGKKALAHGVIITVADRSHRRSYAGLFAAHAKRNRSVLAAPVRMMNHTLGTPLPQRHVQGVEHQLRLPGVSRLNASSTTARNRKPAQVGMYVMSATQS